ncbi:hypothetical protein GW17_00033447 [Ensete ventricosum]|nr:hypothetical protein GW17_00033447 [Ensete ventricosum]RZS15815.1 hypothetical protein BHM03_00047718 [Ensete ventricosum]
MIMKFARTIGLTSPEAKSKIREIDYLLSRYDSTPDGEADRRTLAKSERTKSRIGLSCTISKRKIYLTTHAIFSPILTTASSHPSRPQPHERKRENSQKRIARQKRLKSDASQTTFLGLGWAINCAATSDLEMMRRFFLKGLKKWGDVRLGLASRQEIWRKRRRFIAPTPLADKTPRKPTRERPTPARHSGGDGLHHRTRREREREWRKGERWGREEYFTGLEGSDISRFLHYKP